MESVTKNRQTLGVLRDMIARGYGDDLVPDGPSSDDRRWADELGHGWFNVAYVIRLRDGRRVVLKIAPPPTVPVMTYERGAMRTEIAALQLIKESTSVPVPTVDFADLSHELCDADYFFMPYVDADNLGVVADSLPAEQLIAYNEKIGALNRELNTIRGDHFGMFAGPAGDAGWRDAFCSIVEDVLVDGERRAVDIGRDYRVIRRLLDEHAPALDEVTEPQYVEWDLWNSNVMIRDGEIVCVIDHERPFFGDPLMEAGFVATQLPAFGDSVAFMRGYGWAELNEVQRIRRRLYSLHLALIMVIETVYRGHTDRIGYDWGRARLDEVLAGFGRPGS